MVLFGKTSLVPRIHGLIRDVEKVPLGHLHSVSYLGCQLVLNFRVCQTLVQLLRPVLDRLHEMAEGATTR